MSKWCYAAGIVVLNELSMSVYATEVKAVTPGWHLPFAFHPAGWFWLVLTGIVGLVVGALLGTRHVRRSWRYGDSEENVRKTTLNGEDAGAFQKTCSEIGIFPFYCDKNGHLIVEGDASEFWPLRGGLPIPPEEWLIPEDLSNFKLGWDALLSGKKREILLTYRTKGETTVKHYEMRVQRIPDGGFSGIVRDITELKTGEAMVEDTAFMFRSVLDSLPGHLFIKDVEKGFRYTLMNRNDDLFFDRRSRNCVGKTDFDIFPEDKAKQMRHEDEEIVRSGKDFESIIVIPASNGNNMYMKVFKRLLVKADGTRLIIGIGMNITRERELEHELEKNIRRLNVHIRDEQNFSSCLEIVLGSDDFDFVINSFLTKLGEVSKVDRCSIFRYDEKDLSFSCT
ncbi:MAG: PAS domain-containing protein, partial [Victivallales bacterium]|nr:PAS domain-containing protein [Victivallales bacterium]